MPQGAGGAFQPATPKLVLASGSTARRTLLAATGLSFASFAADIDEAAVKVATRQDGGTPEHAAMALAGLKAAAYTADPTAMVIGCDQILVCNGTWFDKPSSLAQARHHLEHLRGRTHTLVTATLVMRGGARIWTHLATPRLTMRPFTAAFIDAYLAAEGDALLGSVGAYRLEGAGMQLFDAVEGEFSAILGLPLLSLLGYLRAQKIVLT